MRKQVVVLGLGRFGRMVAITLHQLHHQVLAVDSDAQRVQEIIPLVTEAVRAEATDEAALQNLGVAAFDAAVVAVGDIPTSLMATVLLKRLGVPFVVARANDDLHGVTLEKLGADRVVYPERETGLRLAHALNYPDVVDYLEVTRDFGVSKLTPPEHFIGHTLEELGLGRGRDALNVLVIRRSNNQVVVLPDRFERVLKGDLLILAGRDESLERVGRSA
ncbi:MAG: TrkA family potassium uptake protein [Chloroflexi bacterium]|nr:TrkA family potassium uptake protein [Chloroflexota bacterium]